MPRYRYEAVDGSGVPIHGTLEAADEADLAARLQQRYHKLVSAEELSLDHLVEGQREILPRLVQLRLGEQLREALLTGLPAHEAVRAIAMEPLTNPMISLMPWLYAMAGLLMLFFGSFYWLTGYFFGIVLPLCVVAVVVLPATHLALKWMYELKPRSALLRLAGRLESGVAVSSGLSPVMPGELRAVMKANVPDEAKARVATELMPRLLSGRLRSQQFLSAFIGPLILFCFVVAGLHALLLAIVPKFKAIFMDFGTQLPMMTQSIIGLSDMVGVLGVSGWLAVAAALAIGVVLLSAVLSSVAGAQAMESVPLFGVSFRWAMQARVARVLAAMVRQDCPYPETVRAATVAGGFTQIRLAGDQIAESLESGDAKQPESSRGKLSGLPISMLYAKADKLDDKEHRAAIASTFQGISEMLDSAAVGQGYLFATILQWLTVFFMGMVVGWTVIALFLPLIKLLNDLS